MAVGRYFFLLDDLVFLVLFVVLFLALLLEVLLAVLLRLDFLPLDLDLDFAVVDRLERFLPAATPSRAAAAAARTGRYTTTRCPCLRRVLVRFLFQPATVLAGRS